MMQRDALPSRRVVVCAVAACLVLCATVAACVAGGEGCEGAECDAGDAGANDDVVDAGSNAGATPVFSEEFTSTSPGWPGWTCLAVESSVGRAVEGGGTGNLLVTQDGRVGCTIDTISVVDVDLLVDVVLSPSDGEDPVTAHQGALVSVRRHLVAGGFFWDADELEALVLPNAAGGIDASFVAAANVHETDPTPLALASAAEAAIDVPLVDDTRPVRLRVRVDGAGPTRMRLKAWSANLSEPTEWLIDATLALDADFLDDNFGFALSTAADGVGAPSSTFFDNFTVYDAATVSADVPLP